MKSGDILGGKYQLEQEIGKGAMGAVWAAYDHDVRRRVALKVILPQQKEQLTNDLRQRLMREARACWKLYHRNIVQIFDMGETQHGDPYLVLELLNGQTLQDMLKEKRRIAPPIAARIAAEVANGLAAAHATNIIHRDLKPANIFLHREEGTPEDMFVAKILDFGVCKSLDSVDSIATQTGTAVGSPAYMSPEQVGLRKDLDGRTDIWSLGIVIYEMLTGSRPFVGSVQEVIRQILITPVPPPSAKVRDVPPELDTVVARCTMPKRDDRYAKADEVSQALHAIAGGPRPMTRKATFQGLGGSSPVAAQASMTATAPLPPMVPRAVTAPVPAPMEEDASDLAATLPLQGRMLADMRSAKPFGGRGEDASTGTQLLQPNAPVASPAPAWKQEMQQAIAEHRQSSASLEAVMPEQAANGQTQMITPELRATLGGAPQVDVTGTTSAAGALSHPTGGYPAPPMPMMPMDPAVATGKRKKSKKVLFAVMAAGVAAAIVVVALLAVNADKLRATEASPTVPEATPQPSATEAPVVELPRPPVTAETTAEPVATAAPTSEPAVEAPKEEKTAEPVVTAAPTPKPTYKAPPKPAPKEPACTGVGLFKKCIDRKPPF